MLKDMRPELRFSGWQLARRKFHLPLTQHSHSSVTLEKPELPALCRSGQKIYQFPEFPHGRSG
jgi:hypothetical protein